MELCKWNNERNYCRERSIKTWTTRRWTKCATINSPWQLAVVVSNIVTYGENGRMVQDVKSYSTFSIFKMIAATISDLTTTSFSTILPNAKPSKGTSMRQSAYVDSLKFLAVISWTQTIFHFLVSFVRLIIWWPIYDDLFVKLVNKCFSWRPNTFVDNLPRCFGFLVL